MIKVTPGKDWRKARSLLRNYGKRQLWVQQEVVRNLAHVFLKKLKAFAPKGKEYDEYLDSLKVVSLTGVGKDVGYAVVSERAKVSLEELRGKEGNPTVVYVEMGRGAKGNEPLIFLMAQNNPWPPDMIPFNLASSAMLVHTVVTQPEYDFAEAQAKQFLKINAPAFSRLGAKFKRSDAESAGDLTSLNSLPDYLSFALRKEFGINVSPHPHWRPALRAVANSLEKIIDTNDNISTALYDINFRDHLKSRQVNDETMSLKKFDKEAGVFEGRVGKVVGASLG